MKWLTSSKGQRELKRREPSSAPLLGFVVRPSLPSMELRDHRQATLMSTTRPTNGGKHILFTTWQMKNPTFPSGPSQTTPTSEGCIGSQRSTAVNISSFLRCNDLSERVVQMPQQCV